MRIFKYWVTHSKVLQVDSYQQPSKIYGGSNISEADALQDAERKFNRIQKIINGELFKDPSYEADILEEIIETIDTNNIITRNRYGALVLNSKDLLFIDVDEHFKSLYERLFKRSATKKELMLQRIIKTAEQSKYQDLGFRIYETCKGYRVLVTNKTFDPRSKTSKRMMRDFNADYIYEWLCIKQNCYRARLTPKPYRMRHKAIRVRYPERTPEQTQELARWVQGYEQASQRFSTCKLIKEIGRTQITDAVAYHDKVSGVQQDYKLA